MNNKVLVVDDEVGMRSLFVKLLARQGCDVLTAGRGREAIKITKIEHPKVVILDIKMPGMNGIEVLEKIREEASDARAVIVTGYPSFKVSKEAKRLGVDEIIPKPFNIAKIVRVIKTALFNYNKSRMINTLRGKHFECPYGHSSCLFCDRADCPLINEAEDA